MHRLQPQFMPRFPVTLTTMAQIIDKGIIGHAARFAHTLEVGVLSSTSTTKGRIYLQLG
jgi:hypothetical protein